MKMCFMCVTSLYVCVCNCCIINFVGSVSGWCSLGQGQHGLGRVAAQDLE